MKGKNKKTKKAAVKIAKRKSKAAKPKAVKPKKKITKTKKSESILGSSLPSQELGARIFVRQEDADTQPIEPQIQSNDLGTISEASSFTEFDFDDQEMTDPEALESGAELAEPQIYSDQPVGMSKITKTVIMYVAVSSIMAVIVFFWFLSVKYSLSQNMQVPVDPQTSESLNSIRASMGSLKDDFNTISDIAKDQMDKSLNSAQNENTNAQAQIPDDIAKQLKDKLENLNANDNGNINSIADGINN